MNDVTHLRVSTPQGEAGELTQEKGRLLHGRLCRCFTRDATRSA